MKHTKLLRMAFLTFTIIIFVLPLIFLNILIVSNVQASTVSTFVADPESGNTFPNFDEIRLYDTASVTVSIDPALTSWIAWNDNTSAVYTGGGCTNCLGPGSFGTDDYISLTVTNPGSSALTLTLDWNDASGNSSGPQNVIFGTADDAPDVYRSSTGPINEGGAFNSIFTVAGNYTFKFDFYNRWSYNYAHGNIYLFVEPTAVPIPSAVWLLGSGLIGIVGVRRKFKK